jgi:NADPH2:quinone reductase
MLLPAQALSPAPAGLNDFEAAACSVTALTAWVSLVRQAQLRAGESVLVHGAGGGVGLALVQLARHLGAQVIATASRIDKLAAACKAGADFGIVLRPGWPQQVLALTNGEGVDVCVDPVGGEVFETSIPCMAWAGRMLTVGFASGRIPWIAFDQILPKGLSVLGVRAGEWGRRSPVEALNDARQIGTLLDQGVLVPSIGACFPLSEGVHALRSMAERKVAGKICLAMP